MPIYEYQCKKCGTQFEVLQKFNDPKPPCEECNSKAVSKLVSNTSFVLKGEGWYVTDYAQKEQKAKKQRKEAGAGDAEGSKPSSEGEAGDKKKSEKKPKKKAKTGS